MNFSDLVFIDTAGYHYADFPTILEWVQDQFRDVYGQDVYLGDDSQDGQWTTVLAQGFYDVSILGATVYNGFSPTSVQGVALSRLFKINGIFRQNATHSTVNLDIGGTVGTSLVLAVAVDSFQNKWSIPDLTIPSGGTITVTATAVEEGAISAEPNTITGIFTPTFGWQTVNNPAAATIGRAIESDAALRIKQRQSTSLPTLTVFESTIAAVRNVKGVTNAVGYENPTNTTDGNGLPPHSIAIVVAGGDSLDIAKAIQIKKTPGTETFGTTSELVNDSHGMPITINFFIADPATINVRVTINPLTGYSSSYAALIQQAVAAVVTSPMVGSTEIIGGTIVLNQLYTAAYLSGTQAAGSFTVVSIEISKNGDALGSSNIVLDFDEIPVCDPDTDVEIVT